jgi:hypothetical protein
MKMAGKGNIENLKPQNMRTKEEQRKIAAMGGRASQKKQKEKKLMSDIYSDILAEQISGEKGIKLKDVVNRILIEGGSPSVSMLKEIREATEGNKIALSGELDCNINIVPVKSKK